MFGQSFDECMCLRMQFVIWVVIPSLNSSAPALDTMKALRFVVFLQYLPRLLRLFPLLSKMVNTTGVLMETAWAGAAFNLLLYMLASHVSAFSRFLTDLFTALGHCRRVFVGGELLSFS